MDNEELLLLLTVRPEALCLDNLVRAMAICSRRKRELEAELNARRMAQQSRQPFGEASDD